MDTFLQVTSLLVSAGFAVVALLAFRDWRRWRDRPHAALAAALGLLGLVSVAGQVHRALGNDVRLLSMISTVGFAACGYALLEYRATVVPLSVRARVLAITALGGSTTTLLVLRPPMGTDPRLSIPQMIAVDALVIAWALCVLEPIVRFWSVSRTRPAIERVRLRLLAASYAAIAFVLVLAISAGRALRGWPAALVAIQVLMLGIPALAYMSVAAPLWMRRRWLGRESRRVASTILPVDTWFWEMQSGVMGGSVGACEGSEGRCTLPGWMARAHPEDRAAVEEALLVAIDSASPFGIDHRVVLPSGEIRWMHERGEVAVDPTTRRPAAVYGTTQDVTYRKLADAAVVASEARLAETQALAHLGGWSVDLASHDATWSDEMFRICGIEPVPGPVSPERQQDFVHPDDVEMLRGVLADLMRDRRSFEVEHRLVRPTGEVRWVAVQGAVRTSDGEPTHVHGTAQDITERKLAELALRRSEEHFKQLVESAPDAVAIIDAEGCIVLVNDATARLFGYDREALIGSPVEQLVPESLRKQHVANRARYLAAPSRRAMALGHDVVARRKNGSEVAVDISLSPIQTDEGPLVVASIRDVTERRRAEQALVAAFEREKEVAERLRSIDRMKDAFLEAVSHELRTPLAVVLGLGETLARDDVTLPADQARFFAHRLVANAHRLERLLSDLLDLDRIRRGALDPQRRPTDLAELARSVVEDIDLMGHKIEVEADDAIANLGRSQVERIIENLLINAVRHTPPGTQIRLRVRAVNDGVLLLVEDEGPGVPDELKDSIFRPFERGDSSAARAKGTGIGLSLVAQFANLHGGRAWVEDRAEGGARFAVFLPDAPDLEISPARERSASTP